MAAKRQMNPNSLKNIEANKGHICSEIASKLQKKSAAKRREKKSFQLLLQSLLDMPMEELEGVSPRLAIVKKQILLAAVEGKKDSADWVVENAGEKQALKQEHTGSDGGPILVLIDGGDREPV